LSGIVSIIQAHNEYMAVGLALRVTNIEDYNLVALLLQPINFFLICYIPQVLIIYYYLSKYKLNNPDEYFNMEKAQQMLSIGLVFVLFIWGTIGLALYASYCL
jgi:hypothetical protein